MSQIEKHFTKLLALLTGVFAVVRILSYRQMSDSVVTKIPVLDSETYFKWGYQLSQGGGHPPGEFWLGPGYPQFIGWVIALTGDVSPHIVLIAQMLLSCATFVLVLLMTRRIFGEMAALFAGVLGILYAPWLYFDVVIVSASWILFLNSVMFYLLIEYGGLFEQTPPNPPASRGETEQTPPLAPPLKGGGIGNWWAWAVAGGVCALSAIARPSILLFAIMLMLVLGWRIWKKEIKPVYLIAFLSALIVVHLPMSIRNAREGGSPIFVTASGGVNFFIGNRDGATGVYDELDFIQSFSAQMESEGYRKEASQRSGHELTLSQAASYWQDQALRDVFQNPVGWIRLQFKKLWWILRNEEVANNFSFRAMQMINTVVNSLPVRWGLLLPLALTGIVMFWQMRKRLWFYWIYFAGYVLTVMMFFASSEYRFPLVIMLLPLAGAGIAGIVQGFREKRTTHVAVALVAYVALLVVSNMPSKTAHNEVVPRVDFANVGSMALAYQMYSEALAMFSRALAVDPEFQPARVGLADALWATRNFDQARKEYERAGVASPDSISGARLEALYARLDSVLKVQGDSVAIAMYDSEIPNLKQLSNSDVWIARARLQAQAKNWGGAYLSMMEAHKVDPGNPEWLYLAAEYILMLDFPAQADSLYGEAIKLYPAYAPARVQKGFLAYEMGDLSEALAQSRELDKIQIQNDSIKAKAHTLDSLLRHTNW